MESITQRLNRITKDDDAAALARELRNLILANEWERAKHGRKAAKLPGPIIECAKHAAVRLCYLADRHDWWRAD